MLFQHTWKQVIHGEKTRTSRLIRPGEWLGELVGDKGSRIEAVFRWIDLGKPPRIVYQVGGTRAVQTERTSPGLWARDDGDAETIYGLAERYGGTATPKDIRLFGWWRARICITAIYRQDVRTITHEQARAEGFYNRDDFMATWLKMHDPAVWRKHHTTPTVFWWPYVLPSRPLKRYDAWVLELRLLKQ